MLTILDAAVGHPIPRRYSQPRPRAGRRSRAQIAGRTIPASGALGVVVGVCALLRKALVNEQVRTELGPGAEGLVVVIDAAGVGEGVDCKREMQWGESEGSRTKPRNGPVMSSELEHHGIFLASSACRSTKSAVDSENRASPLPSLCPSVERRYQKGTTACKWTASAQTWVHTAAFHHIDSLFVNAEPSPSCRHNTRRL